MLLDVIKRAIALGYGIGLAVALVGCVGAPGDESGAAEEGDVGASGDVGEEGGAAEASQALCSMPGPADYTNDFDDDPYSNNVTYTAWPLNHFNDGCGTNVRVRGTPLYGTYCNTYSCYNVSGVTAWSIMSDSLPSTQAACESAYARVYLYAKRRSDGVWEYVGYENGYGTWNGWSCAAPSAGTVGWGGYGTVSPAKYSAVQANCYSYASGAYKKTECGLSPI